MGSAKQLIQSVVRDPWEIATISDSFVILTYHHFGGVVVSSTPSRGWF